MQCDEPEVRYLFEGREDPSEGTEEVRYVYGEGERV